MELVTEHTVLEVGKFYNVPCAKLVNSNGVFIEFTPIIGKSHTDVQFGVIYEHYHIDGRFTPKYNYHDVDVLGLTNRIISKKSLNGESSYSETIVIKRRKCRRLTTGIKPPKRADKYNSWYNSMIGKSCKGKRCPHLGTVMMEQNGILICPLHNLQGCVEKEVIIKQMDR